VLAANRKNSTIAILETNRGSIEIELFREAAPVTVANFVLSAKGGDYRRMRFETVIQDRLLEGVSPKARSGLLHAIPGEVNMKQFERGSVGMGRINGDSETGHIFVALTPQPFLDGIHTCFGRVISGMPVADRIVSGDYIRKVTIRESISFLDRQTY
jgi:peptidyl-prolyl cis-trans isomerase B (cyclophilin B)